MKKTTRQAKKTQKALELKQKSQQSKKYLKALNDEWDARERMAKTDKARERVNKKYSKKIERADRQDIKNEINYLFYISKHYPAEARRYLNKK